MNVLITGANGQLGNEMRILAPNNRDNIYFFTDVAELDITDINAIRLFVLEHNIDIIVNCAAYTNVDKAEDDYDAADLINNKAVENLATVCKDSDAVFIHISTDYVFGGNENLPYTEIEQTNPLGVYGKTKFAGEESILRVGCKFIIIRTAWLYSEYGSNFVKTMMRLTSEKDTIKVVFDQVGTPTYAGDLAKVVCHIIDNSLYEKYLGVYHFSNEGVCSWYDFAKEIASLAGNVCDVQPCHSDEFPSKVKRPAFSVMDKTKLKTDFNFVVPYWKDSLEKCIKKLQLQ